MIRHLAGSPEELKSVDGEFPIRVEDRRLVLNYKLKRKPGVPMYFQGERPSIKAPNVETPDSVTGNPASG